MKQLAVIFTFPYLAPITMLLSAGYLRSVMTHSPQSTASFSGGEVASYYVLIPIAVVIQICFGIPGSILLRRSASRRLAILCCVLMSMLPFLLLSSNMTSPQFTLSSLLPILGIATFFGLGSCVSYFMLYHKKIKKTEQAGDGDAEEAV